MNDVTDEQIIDLAQEIWPGAECRVRRYGNIISLEAVKSNSLDLSFAILLKFSKLLGTENINESRYKSEGCDTCGYGSVSTLTLTFRD